MLKWRRLTLLKKIYNIFTFHLMYGRQRKARHRAADVPLVRDGNADVGVHAVV